jgi:diguanylate cyclase (GGDEF)-like protein
VLLPIALAVPPTILLVAFVLLPATRESDRVAWERQYRLVAHVLSEQVAKISHDQESVTIWDDAIEKTVFNFDHEWIDINLGVWMYDYFGHDRTFVLNASDSPIYAMVDGASADTSAYRPVRAAVEPLAKELRDLLRSSDLGDAAAEPDRFSAADLVIVEQRPAIASVLPIVSDTGNIEMTPGSEFFLVSIRFLDGSFVDELMRGYLLNGARFAWTNDAERHEAAFPLANAAGEGIGFFIWQPDRPGWHLFTRMAPALALALALTAGIVLVLARRLRRASAELQASEAQAQHLAFHDPLTGLPNRALFVQRLDRALTETRRSGSPTVLLYLDLDRFKNVNDTLGHAAGDELIRVLADRLGAVLRSGDCLARLGGDEFAVVLCDSSSADEISALCERIIAEVSQPFQLLGSAAFVGVSIGVAIAPDCGTDRAEIMRKADIALYRAKLEGRNRFRIFSEEMDIFLQRRREVESELRTALAAGDQLQVVYQPLYAAVTGKLSGVEALLRWTHPKHGSVSPHVFIPIAEESGLIHAIGDFVLREACRAAARWPFGRIAVNVSPVQFRSPRFAVKALDIMRESSVEPKRLEFEITESVLLDNAELSGATFQMLRNAGVRIALDDFGTGYSSLTYLQKLPVDRIKIDRSFVHTLDTDSASDAIVQAMVDLARAVGVEVTAEGVESAEQREFLRRVGCDELQGFLLSRPLTEMQVDRLVGSDAPAEREVVSAA